MYQHKTTSDVRSEEEVAQLIDAISDDTAAKVISALDADKAAQRKITPPPPARPHTLAPDSAAARVWAIGQKLGH